ncbi:hypothetical protein D3C78_928500 [compost metagenome]
MLQDHAQAGRPVLVEHRLQQARLQAGIFFADRGQQAEGFRHGQRRVEGLRVVIVIHIARQQDAQQARTAFAALAVAAEPEQVFHHPRRQVGVAAHHVPDAQHTPPLPGLAADVPLAEHPGVLARPAPLHRQGARTGAGRHPGQAAGHHPVAVGAGHGEHAHADRSRFQPAALGLPDRRLGKQRTLLADIGVGPLAQALGQRRALLGIQLGTELRGEVLRGKGGADQQLGQLFQRFFQHRRLAAPPAGDRRQLQFRAEQPFADQRQKARQAGRFQHAAAQGIGHQHAALAHRIEQPRHTERRVGAQLQRVAEVVVEAAQQRVHALQPAEGLQVDGAVAHGQVAALDQRIAELARQVEVLEVGLVEAPRGQQHHQRRLAVARRLARQGVLQGAEVAGQVLHAQVAVQLGKGARDDLPVLQRIAGAGRRLGAVGGDPPAAVRRPRQVHRIQVQEGAARRLHALAGPEEVVVAEHQLGR